MTYIKIKYIKMKFKKDYKLEIQIRISKMKYKNNNDYLDIP